VEAAYQTLKETRCTTTILVQLQPREWFVIDTDASNILFGGALSQVQDGQERVIVCYSKTLNKAKKNYCVTRRELLAIARSLEYFRKCHCGQEFHLRTYHCEWIWIKSLRTSRDKSPIGFSVYNSKTSLPSTVKAQNTMLVPSRDDHAKRSSHTAI
jgi:hypothetical protein